MKIHVDKNQTPAGMRATSPLRREVMKIFPTLRAGDSIGMTQLETIGQARSRGIVTPRRLACRVQNAWYQFAKETGSKLKMLVRQDHDGGYRVHLVAGNNDAQGDMLGGAT